jgi:hypothetical protein
MTMQATENYTPADELRKKHKNAWKMYIFGPPLLAGTIFGATQCLYMTQRPPVMPQIVQAEKQISDELNRPITLDSLTEEEIQKVQQFKQERETIRKTPGFKAQYDQYTRDAERYDSTHRATLFLGGLLAFGSLGVTGSIIRRKREKYQDQLDEMKEPHFKP